MSTGVKIMPRDSTGYIYDGIYATYQIARRMQERYAELHPEMKAEFARQARALNQLHLSRILRVGLQNTNPEAWNDHAKYFVENMPRAERRKWQAALAGPKWNIALP